MRRGTFPLTINLMVQLSADAQLTVDGRMP